MYTRRRISPSLSYVTERGEMMTKDGEGIGGSTRTEGLGFLRYRFAVPPSLPVTRLAGQPTFIFVTVNEDQRYFATVAGKEVKEREESKETESAVVPD
jgi:hypothetical protein